MLQFHLRPGVFLYLILSALAAHATAQTTADNRSAAPSPAAPSRSATATAPSITREQQARINAARTADEAINLGKLYAVQRAIPAAQAAIDRAVKLKPELLTDSKRETPAGWNEIWFSHRAAIRESRLKPDDAKGRVELAKWLNDAGFLQRARQMLTRALEIDENLPEAQELAEAWHLFGGGPVQIDLRPGVNLPLLAKVIKDENQETSPRGDRVWLLLPFSYAPSDNLLSIDRRNLKATADDGSACTVKGFLLLNPTGGQVDPQKSILPELTLQNDSDPIWEKIEVRKVAEDGAAGGERARPAPAVGRDRGAAARDDRMGGRRTGGLDRLLGAVDERGGGAGTGEDVAPIEEPPARIELTCHNTSYPVPPRTPGAPRVATPPRDRSTSRQTREASGFAIFVVDVPASAKAIECVVRGAAAVTIPLDFLKLLGEPTKDLAEPQRLRMVQLLAPLVNEKQGAVASAAVAKLAAIRAESSQPFQNADATAGASALTQALDRALLTAMGAADARARQTAFNILINTTASISPAALEIIRGGKDVALQLAILRALRETLQNARPATEGMMPSPSSNQPDALLEQAVSPLPESPVSPNVFTVLDSFLKSREPQVRDAALEAILADGSRQSIRLLARVPAELEASLVTRLPEVRKGEAKAAILRMMLLRAEPETALKLLEACKGVSFTITGENDPLVLVGMSRPDEPILVQWLELLAGADISAVVASQKFNALIETLATDPTHTPPVLAAMLKLGITHLKVPYEAPFKRERPQQGDAKATPTGPFERLLAVIAANPKADAESARTAVLTLLAAGRLEMMKDSFLAKAPETRKLEIIKAATTAKELAGRESVPAFLSLCLESKEVRVLQAALTALADLDKATPSTDRWRLSLAISQNVDPKALIGLTRHKAEPVARLAMQILARVGAVNAAELKEFEAMPEAEARQARFEALDRQHALKPSGRYACLVVADFKSVADPNASSNSPAGAKPAARRNVPLVSESVTVRPVGKELRILVENRDIRTVDLSGAQVLAGAEGQPQTLRIDASILLRAALNSADAQKEGVKGAVDSLMLGNAVPAELRYDRMGVWTGEVTLQDSGPVLGQDKPLKLAGAKIYLVPLGA